MRLGRGVFSIGKTTWGRSAWTEPRWFFYLLVMDKDEILHRLKTSGELRVMDDTKNWKEAFRLYNESTGFQMKAEDRCQKCYQKVSDWLQGIK